MLISPASGLACGDSMWAGDALSMGGNRCNYCYDDNEDKTNFIMIMVMIMMLIKITMMIKL